MRIQGFGVTDPGLVRENNEDAILADNDLHLYVVCDGMGGHAAGEVASATALKAIKSKVNRQREELRSLQASGKGELTLIRDIVRYACAAVYHRSADSESYRGMGTTVTMMLVIGSRAVVGHVGDSRLYLLRRGVLTQLTRDHTLGQDLVDRGELSEDQVREHFQANALTRAVGVYEDVEVDTFQFELLLGDRVLMCSDGLYDALPELGPYVNLLAAPAPAEKAPQELVSVANRDGGGPDNVSVLVVSIDAEPGQLEEEESRRAEVMLSIDAVKQLYIFRELEFDELLEVSSNAVLQVAEPADTIVAEGEEGDAMYLLVEGKCHLERDGVLITKLEAGSHFGEMSLLIGTPRSATVVADAPSKMLRIARSDFQSIALRRPSTGVKLLLALGKELSRRLIASNDRAL